MKMSGHALASRRRPVGSGSMIAALAAFVTVGAVAVCGSEVATTQASGGTEEFGNIELQNVTVEAELTGATPDSTVSAFGNATLAFTAVNVAATEADRLLETALLQRLR